MAIDKKLQIFDDEGNPVDYDILASDVKFEPDGKDLPTKLAEMEQEIEDAGSGDGTVTGVKMNNGSPIEPDGNGVVDLGTVITQHQDISGKVDKDPNKELIPSTDLAKLQNLPTATELTTQLGQKANDNAVVKSVSVNGGTPQTPQNGNVNIEVQSGGQVTVTTNNDGTFTIHSGDNDYTINLNHTHEGMVKLEKYTEGTMPQTKDDDIIYVQVDDVTTPTGIEKLYLFGLEFAGGGVPDTGEPMISSPSNNSTINLGDNTAGQGVSKTITIKGKNLTGDITVTVGTGLTISYGQSTGQSSVTIPMAQALLGAQVTIAYSGTGALDDGSLVIRQGNDVLSSVVVIVVAVVLPEGFTRDAAWNGENKGSTDDQYSAPGTQVGYCTTPFYQVTKDSSNKLNVIIKGGFISGTDIPKGLFVYKKALGDTYTSAAYNQSTDPRNHNPSAADANNIHNYISATMKISELANCYIYDVKAGAYLFAGANVDQSTAPNI